jgi:hypothetical protein
MKQDCPTCNPMGKDCPTCNLMGQMANALSVMGHSGMHGTDHHGEHQKHSIHLPFSHKDSGHHGLTHLANEPKLLYNAATSGFGSLTHDPGFQSPLQSIMAHVPFSFSGDGKQAHPGLLPSVMANIPHPHFGSHHNATGHQTHHPGLMTNISSPAFSPDYASNYLGHLNSLIASMPSMPSGSAGLNAPSYQGHQGPHHSMNGLPGGSMYNAMFNGHSSTA